MKGQKMYAIKIPGIKRGGIRKTTRWAEKIGEDWFLIPRLSNIIYNKSEGIVKTKRQAKSLLSQAQKALGCDCEIVRVGLVEVGPDMLL